MLRSTCCHPAHVILAICIGSGASACQPQEETETATETAEVPHVVAPSTAAAGRYLVILGGCNDCHTDGYLDKAGDVPEAQWLLGSQLGWRGPWGTTYARNLRLTVEDLSENDWVTMLRSRKDLPPMPWMNINRMTESDARAMYQYIQSLGPGGNHMPDVVPPDEEPATPYIWLVPVIPGEE